MRWINIIVTAIGWETSDCGAARFEQEVLIHRPDGLTLDCALIDRQIGLEKARPALTAMIEKALARQIRIILLTPTGDLSADLNNPDDPLNQHTEQIRALAREYQVALTDSLTVTKRASPDLTDREGQVEEEL